MDKNLMSLSIQTQIWNTVSIKYLVELRGQESGPLQALRLPSKDDTAQKNTNITSLPKRGSYLRFQCFIYAPYDRAEIDWLL
jgi:hypothetical protein